MKETDILVDQHPIKPEVLTLDDPIYILSHETGPSDYVMMDDELSMRLFEIWHSKKEDEIFVPSDLLKMGTVPIQHLKIIYKYHETSYRVCIFDFERYVNINWKDDYMSGRVSGAVVYEVDNKEFIIPIIINDTDVINIPDKALFLKQHIVENIDDEFNTAIIQQTLRILLDWYSIQIALLHPQLKEVFANPKIDRVFDSATSNNTKGKKRRITKYVKKHYISLNDVDLIIHQGNGKYQRHTQIWYVIGHTRHYKNGSEQFIKGYWKGPLREFKRNFDTRERVIDEDVEL